MSMHHDSKLAAELCPLKAQIKVTKGNDMNKFPIIGIFDISIWLVID